LLRIVISRVVYSLCGKFKGLGGFHRACPFLWKVVISRWIIGIFFYLVVRDSGIDFIFINEMEK
jgi:hypothetical protein